jgi:aquaporin Z
LAVRRRRPAWRERVASRLAGTSGICIGNWMKNTPMIKKLAAEAFGTFWLVFGGCGSAVLAAGFPDLGIGFVGVSLALGLTVLTMAYAVGHISGGHFNPAVSLGLAMGGRFAWSDMPLYRAAQVVGGVVAALLLFAIASGAP